MEKIRGTSIVMRQLIIDISLKEKKKKRANLFLQARYDTAVLETIPTDLK